MNWKMAVAGLMAAGLVTGCTSTQKGAAIGAGLGGAGAWLATSNTANVAHPYQAGLIGAAAGGLAGALIGDALDETRNPEREESLATANAALEAERSRLAAENARLQADLAKKLAEKNAPITITVADGQIRFTILNEILFDSGKSEIKAEGVAVLDSVLEMIQKDYADRKIMVEGHTDNQPIVHSKWADNWELSYARSAAVVKHFIADKGIGGERLSALACGEFRPVADNGAKEGQRQNRRAVIVVLPADKSITVEHK
jgi:chemotaxis protein MotB